LYVPPILLQLLSLSFSWDFHEQTPNLFMNLTQTWEEEKVYYTLLEIIQRNLF
jgi:hypothetical protein